MKLIQTKRIVCVVLVCSVNVWGMETESLTEVRGQLAHAPAEKEIEGLVSIELTGLKGDVREIEVGNDYEGPLRTVSYTHLDVYKRQPLERTKK